MSSTGIAAKQAASCAYAQAHGINRQTADPEGRR